MHVIQKRFSENDYQDAPVYYTIEGTIYDGLGDDKKVIGHSDETDAGDKNPLNVSIEGLDIVLVITPETQHDYIQFMLGSQGWKSSDKGSCSLGGWDPRQGYPAVSFFPPFVFHFVSTLASSPILVLNYLLTSISLPF